MTADPVERGFLRSIIEHHTQDAPRLTYADWLQERDRHDRAEFIRGQCELARHDGEQVAAVNELFERLLNGDLSHKAMEAKKQALVAAAVAASSEPQS